MGAELDSGGQGERNQPRVLAGKKEAMKHWVGFSNNANPIPSFTSQAEQAPGQNLGLVTQIAIG